MTFKYRHRKLIILVIVVGIFIGSSSLYFVSNKKTTKKKEIIKSERITKETIEKASRKKEENNLSVDIKGEVANPGIYSLSKNSRVIDVVEKAGGLTENANTTVINLSKKIIDEMVIIIYSNAEVEDFKKTKEVEKEVINKCIQKDENSLVNDACINTNNNIINGKVSINTGTLEELITLPGIGEAKAKEIIEYRNNNGEFTSLEQLLEISGIGEGVFAKIKDYITL